MDPRYREIDEKLTDQVHDVVRMIENASLYESSIHEKDGTLFCIIRKDLTKYLLVIPGDSNQESQDFQGDIVQAGDQKCLICECTHENANAIRSRFAFTNPQLIGNADSYGFGDRLGNAGPAHLRSVRFSSFKPILAQQSIRELERTGRTAHDVMDAASWSVFQEGYHDGFGADGDHLKTTEDIDRMVEAGYTMFTIDPSDYVVNEVKSLIDDERTSMYEDLPWKDLKDTPESLLKRFSETDVVLEDGYTLSPERDEVIHGMIKYGRVITHTQKMAEYLEQTYPDHPAELELSVDETDEPTTLFEHYLVASELHRLGVELVSLAPRFCGSFEKGIDFKGDLNQFREEYIRHLHIADLFGGYKLSVHSGSDKFSVYEVIGSIKAGAVHVKTAGTSYLEALRTIAESDADLFREIMAFSIRRFEEDKKTYHISADPDRLADPESLSPEKLQELLDDDDARQVLHVAYGSVLSGTLPESTSFKQRLMETLERNEELYELNLERHFEKHLSPFQ